MLAISLKIETGVALLSVPQQHLFWHYCPCSLGQKAKPPEFHLESISADGKTMSGIQTCGDFVAKGTQLVWSSKESELLVCIRQICIRAAEHCSMNMSW